MLLLYDGAQCAWCFGGHRVASYGLEGSVHGQGPLVHLQNDFLKHELSCARRLAVGASPRAVEAQLTASG